MGEVKKTSMNYEQYDVERLDYIQLEIHLDFLELQLRFTIDGFNFRRLSSKSLHQQDEEDEVGVERFIREPPKSYEYPCSLIVA